MTKLFIAILLFTSVNFGQNHWWTWWGDTPAFVWTWSFGDLSYMREGSDYTSIEKFDGAGSYNADGYTNEGYANSVTLQFKPAQTNASLMFGLNTDPSSSVSYESIDYCFFLINNGSLYVYESDVAVNLSTTYTSNTVLKITYDGVNIRYWKDGVVVRTVARAVGDPLYIDSSFNGLATIGSILYYGN